MRRLLPVLLLAACVPQATPPGPQVRVDTVTVVQTVAPSLPEGTPAEVCLSTGVTALVHISATGDTLIGEQRVPVGTLRPALSWAGGYAGGRTWYTRGDVIRFDGRNYRRSGVRKARVCDELKLVGQHDGIPVFAEVTAPQALPNIIIPVAPGIFQDYGRVR